VTLSKGVSFHMTDIKPGLVAPDFKLAGFQLSEALKKGSVLLTFYKKTCPICQLTYPFFEKIHKYYSGKTFQIIGIAQDPETKSFSVEYGITFPMISDTPTYAVSRQYKLTNVPTAFLVIPDGKIDAITIGFSKGELTTISSKIASITGKKSLNLFAGISVPESKPG